MVVFSLSLQIILILMGYKRKVCYKSIIFSLCINFFSINFVSLHKLKLMQLKNVNFNHLFIIITLFSTCELKFTFDKRIHCMKFFTF